MKRTAIFVLVMLSLSQFGTIAYADLNDGLIGYYPFEGNVNNQYGSLADGTISGVVDYVSGAVGQAIKFDGDSFVQLVNMAVPVGTGTISMWVKLDSNAQNVNEGTANVFYPANNNYRSQFSYNITQGTFNTGDVSHTIQIDQWVHYAFVYENGTSSASGLGIGYVDGQPDGQDTGYINNHSGLNNGGIFIGSNTVALIDDIRIYNRPLSETEIQQLYSLGTNDPQSDGIPTVYVAPGTYSGENLSIVDPGTGIITGTIHIGAGIRDMVLNSTGTRVYCAHLGDPSANPPDPGLVSVIDTTTNTVIDTLNVGPLADDVAINPSGTRLYVSYHSDAAGYQDRDMIAAIDTSTNEVSNTIAIGGDIADMVVSPDGAILYISNPGLNSIIVMNVSTFQVLSNISGLPAPLGLVLNPLGTRLYAACEDGPVGVIDTSTRTVIANIDCGDELDTMAISPDGATLYVPHYYNGYYSVVATATNTVTQTITYSSTDYAAVRGVAVNQDGTRLYIGSIDYDEATYESTPTLFVFATATNQLIDNESFEQYIGRIVILESNTADVGTTAMPWIPLLLLDE